MTTPARTTFDLTTDRWLAVTLTNGQSETWGLRELFARSHEAKGLSEPSPLTHTAIMRYLIAILHRAYKGPAGIASWRRMWDLNAFGAEPIEGYLNSWQHRFDLFHPDQPFAQVPDGGDIKAASPVTRLLMERVSGNNGTLWDHSIDVQPMAMSAADAARSLLTAQAYAFAGAQIFRDSPMIAGYCLFLEGTTLFETLMLNLQRYDDAAPVTLTASDDAPWWELDVDPDIDAAGNRPMGLTDLLTWRSRQIHLFPELDATVRLCSYRPWYWVRPNRVLDPFKRYLPAPDDANAERVYPQSFQEGKALWRDSHGFFPDGYQDPRTKRPVQRPGIVSWVATLEANYRTRGEDLDNEVRPKLLACGIVKATQATVRLWRADRLPLPLSILEEPERNTRVEWAVQLAEATRHGLRKAAATYAREVVGHGLRDPAPEDVSREVTALRFVDRYWAALDQAFPEFLQGLANATDPADAATQWKDDLRRVATGAYFDATDETNTDGNRMRAQAVGSRMLARELKITLS